MRAAPAVRVATSFDDPAVAPPIWSALLASGDTNVASLSWLCQRRWWLSSRREDGLRLIVASLDQRPVAIAPLFVAGGMAMNLCPVNWLDIVGDASAPPVLDALLRAAMQEVPRFVGFRFHFVPDCSRTGELLKSAADRLGLRIFLEDDQPSPILELRAKREAAIACTRKPLMLRRERVLRGESELRVRTCHRAAEVLPQLDEFFDQHVRRWRSTPTPSRYRAAGEREGFRARVGELCDAGWIRFSRLDWKGSAVAFHIGTSYGGRFEYGKTSFEIGLARYSPGTVLLRHVLLEALEEEAEIFDFGLGDEAYKDRFATAVVRLQTWGLYPPESLRGFDRFRGAMDQQTRPRASEASEASQA